MSELFIIQPRLPPSWLLRKEEISRKFLTVGAVRTFKMHNIGAVPMFKMHNVGTAPTSKIHNMRTLILPS